MAADQRITIYVTKPDKKRIYASAASHGEHASEFARRLVLTHLAEDHSHVRKPQRSDD